MVGKEGGSPAHIVDYPGTKGVPCSTGVDGRGRGRDRGVATVDIATGGLYWGTVRVRVRLRVRVRGRVIYRVGIELVYR